MPCFARLPVELVNIVIDNLDDVADLAALARTDRSLYALAVPVLYQRAALQPHPKPLFWAASHGLESTLEKALAAGIDPNHAFVDEVSRRIWRQENALLMMGAVSAQAAAGDTGSECADPVRRSPETEDSDHPPTIATHDTVSISHSLHHDGTAILSVSDSDADSSISSYQWEEPFTDDDERWFSEIGRTYRAIHLAARAGHHAVVEMLLDRGADINAPAYLLCDCPRLYGLLNAVESPEAGAPPLWTPLHLALCRLRPEMAKLLLSRGASHVVQVPVVPGGVEAGAAQGVTALHDAARMGLADVVRHLVDEGIQTDLEVRDTKTLTPMYHAYQGRRWDSTVPLLMQLGADINVDIKLFMPYTAITPMGEACRLGHFEAADRLLDLDAGVMRGFTITTTGATLSPLHMCCMPSARHRAAIHRLGDDEDNGLARMHTIQKLIEKGASVKATDCSGNTPLLVAAENSNVPALQALIGAGVSVRDRDCRGRNALMLAIMARQPDRDYQPDCISKSLAETLRILVHGGVPLDETDAEGNTLLHLFFKGHMSSDSDRGGKKKAVLRYLLSLPGAAAMSRIRNEEGQTPLSLAFCSSNLDACDLLVRKGCLRDELDHGELKAMFAHAVKTCRATLGNTDEINYVLDLDVHGVLAADPEVVRDLVGLVECGGCVQASLVILGRRLAPMTPGDATRLLINAIITRRFYEAHAFLDMGADVNGRHNGCGVSPLIAFINDFQNHQGGGLLPSPQMWFLRALLERGANPHLRIHSLHPDRILNRLIDLRQDDAVLLILEKHPLASDPRAEGGAYLHTALDYKRDTCPSETLVDALLASGADLCEVDGAGDTPLSVLLQSLCKEPRYAWRYRRFIRPLAVPGVDVNRRNGAGKSIVYYLQLLMDPGLAKHTGFLARRIQIVEDGDGTKSLCFLPVPPPEQVQPPPEKELVWPRRAQILSLLND